MNASSPYLSNTSTSCGAVVWALFANPVFVAQQEGDRARVGAAIERATRMMEPFRERPGTQINNVWTDDDVPAATVPYCLLSGPARRAFWRTHFKEAGPTFYNIAMNVLDLPATIRSNKPAAYLVQYFCHSMDWLYNHVIAIDQKNELVQQRLANTYLRAVQKAKTEGGLTRRKMGEFNALFNNSRQPEYQINSIADPEVRPGEYRSNNATRIRRQGPRSGRGRFNR